MTEVVLFHHVLGLTDGVREFAQRLRGGGHIVHTPDLFDGHQFRSIDEGFAYSKSLTDDVFANRTSHAIATLPADIVYAGISWGAAVAQRLAQTRPSARGVLLYEACVPLTGEWAFGPWPHTLAVQIHGKDQDPYFGLEGDLDAAREIVATVGSELAELFVYPGDQHLFTDNTLPSYDADATALVVRRSTQFLDRVG